MMSQNGQRYAKPYNGQYDIHQGKTTDTELKHGRAEKNASGRQQVASAHEKGVDRLLRLVLLLARCREPEQLPSGVHNRIVGSIFCRLHPPDDRKADACSDDGVATERDEGQHQESSSQALVLHQARSDESLESECDDVDPELIAPVV